LILVVIAVAKGKITLEEEAMLSGILEARRKTVKTEDHDKRLSELEAKHVGKR